MPLRPPPRLTTGGCFIVWKHSLGAALLFLPSSRPTGSPQEQVRHSTTVTMSDEEYYGIRQNKPRRKYILLIILSIVVQQCLCTEKRIRGFILCLNCIENILLRTA